MCQTEERYRRPDFFPGCDGDGGARPGGHRPRSRWHLRGAAASDAL